jgi:hypothetical protein
MSGPDPTRWGLSRGILVGSGMSGLGILVGSGMSGPLALQEPTGLRVP